MADNAYIPEFNTGVSVATDDVSGVHYQRVKLDGGGDGASAPIGGDAANGLDVDVTRVIPGTSATHLGKAVDSAAGGTDTGVAALAKRTDTPAAITPANGDYALLQTDGFGRLWTAAVPRPATAGGLTSHRTISAAGTNATSVKASAGQLYGVHVNNVNASARYLKLYNKASAPTVGSDTPVMTFVIPAGGVASFDSALGVAFSAGIAFALTTGLADSDTGAVSASEHVVHLFFA